MTALETNNCQSYRTYNTYRTPSLIAATISFIYHIGLGICANYVPLDGTGFGLVFWLYSWTAWVIAYFGFIGVVARRYTLTLAFAVCLLFDSAILTACRFFVMEYLIRRHRREQCHDTDELFDSARTVVSPEDLAEASRKCELRLSATHAALVVGLVGITMAELWFANAVYRYGRALRQSELLSVAGLEGEGKGYVE